MKDNKLTVLFAASAITDGKLEGAVAYIPLYKTREEANAVAKGKPEEVFIKKKEIRWLNYPWLTNEA